MISRRTFVSIGVAVIALATMYLLYHSLMMKGDDRGVRTVAMTQMISHPALDEVRSGIIAGLQEQGFVNGKNINIVFRNANGDPSLTVPIAQEFVRAAPSLIIPISTPSALAVVKATTSIPIVFSGVTDPIKAGIVKNLEKPGGNVTGVSDRWPYEAQVRAYLQLFPQTKSIGMLFTRGDDVALTAVEALRGLSASLGYRLEVITVSSPQDIYPAAVSLFQKVDAVFSSIDGLVLENLDTLLKASREANKPVFSGDSGSVAKGAVLALSIDMNSFGKLTSTIAARVLRGEKPGDIPVAVVSTGSLVVNRSVASKYGVSEAALAASGAKLID